MLKEEKGKKILYAPLCPKEGYERQSKNYLPAPEGKLSLFHSVQAEADVQYLCVCLKTCYIAASHQRERLDQCGDLGGVKTEVRGGRKQKGEKKR